jgi:hypothetical protein
MKFLGRINIHSVVDVITNSSTTIYTYSDEGSVTSAKEVLAKLMKVLGVEGSVDDYFEIFIGPGGQWLDAHDWANSGELSTLEELGIEEEDFLFFTEEDFDFTDETLKKVMGIEGSVKVYSEEYETDCILIPQDKLGELLQLQLIKYEEVEDGRGEISSGKMFDLFIYAKTDAEKINNIADDFCNLFNHEATFS